MRPNATARNEGPCQGALSPGCSNTHSRAVRARLVVSHTFWDFARPISLMSEVAMPAIPVKGVCN